MNVTRTIPSALALLLCGCVPTVVWLPDGSGLIFTEGEGHTRLVHYDLGTNERTVLAEDTGCFTALPAVSPDGKWISVAQPAAEDDPPRVVVFGRDGKKGRETASPVEGPGEKAITFSHWTASGEVVVMTYRNEHTELWFYDCEENAVTGPLPVKDRAAGRALPMAGMIYGPAMAKPDGR